MVDCVLHRRVRLGLRVGLGGRAQQGVTPLRVVICLVLLAGVISCSRLGDIEARLAAIQHSLEFQKR